MEPWREHLNAAACPYSLNVAAGDPDYSTPSGNCMVTQCKLPN